MIVITVNGDEFNVPSNAADTNWAANQIAFEQALATAINEAIADIASLLSGNVTIGGNLTVTGTTTSTGAMTASAALTANSTVTLGDYGADLNPMGGETVNHTRGAFLVPSGENNWTIANSKILDAENLQMCICQLRASDASARTVQSVDVSTPGSLTVYFTGNLAADNVVDFVILS